MFQQSSFFRSIFIWANDPAFSILPLGSSGAVRLLFSILTELENKVTCYFHHLVWE